MATSLNWIHSPTGIPCLNVGDVDKAVAYYSRFFGLEPCGRDTGSALLRGHGVAVRLRQAPPDWPGARADGPPPDAVILVAQPEILRRRLDDWGAHLVPAADLGPEWGGHFGIRDCYGNVLAVGPVGGRSAATRRLVEPFDTVRRRLYDRRTARAERRQLAGLRSFYQHLADQRDVYYLHFNAGLLHWVLKTIDYVPDDVNLVLIGSDLPVEERTWLAEHVRRPFHHVDIRLDDSGALEFLFDVNQRNFGWLELGCLVLNGALFSELAVVDESTSLNCVWSWDSGFGFPVANTYLLFANVKAIGRVRDSGVDVGPGVYAYERFNRQVEGRRCYSRTPSRAMRDRLRTLLPLDDRGRPAVPTGMASFEPTVAYQLVARTRGLEINRNRGLTGYNHIHGHDVQDEGSDELLYIGGLGYADVLEEFSGYFHDPGVRLLYLIAEYLTLAPTAARLPAHYQQRLDHVTDALAAHDLPPETIDEACRQHLIGVRGMSATAADAVVRPPTAHTGAGRLT